MTGPGCGWSKISRVQAPYDNLGPAVKPLQSPESAVYIMDSLLRDSSASSALRKPVLPSRSCPAPNGPSSSADPGSNGSSTTTSSIRQFGLIHVRLQTWLPFTVQVYVNGHEWLAQQMVHQKLGFVQQHNAFTQLDDPDQGATHRRPLRQARLAEDPRPLGTAGQSLAPRTARWLPRALGRRSGRVRHRLAVQESRGLGRLVPRAAGLRGARPSPPRTSWASSAASGTAASTARSTPTTKTSAGSAPASSTA